MKAFDEVNVATALHRLAKLQPPGTAGPQSPVLRSASFQLLVEASQRLVPRFEAQAVSNTLWGAWLFRDCPNCVWLNTPPSSRNSVLAVLARQHMTLQPSKPRSGAHSSAALVRG